MVLIRACAENLSFFCQKQWMLVSSRDLNYLSAVKPSNFEGCVGLAAFTRVETTLAVLVLPTTNHILRLSQEKRVGETAADLRNIVLDDVKSFHLNWDRSVLYSRWQADLPTKIVAPTINLIKPIIQKPSCWVERICWDNGNGEVFPARNLINFVALKTIYKTRRASTQSSESLVCRREICDAQLPHTVGPNHVEMRLFGQNCGVVFATGNRFYQNVETAGTWYLVRIWFLYFFRIAWLHA